MWLGGNSKFHEYLDTYQLNQAEFETKYKSKAAVYYRQKLATLISDNKEAMALMHLLEPPTPEEGREMALPNAHHNWVAGGDDEEEKVHPLSDDQ